MLEQSHPLRAKAEQPRLQTIVTGISPADVIEFTFVYGDPDLAVELVLPVTAFREFCIENGCRVFAAGETLRTRVQHKVGLIPVQLSLPDDETELHP